MSALDRVVAAGRFKTRADAVRAGIDLLLREEREAEVARTYREAYERHPDDPSIGEAGGWLAAEIAER